MKKSPWKYDIHPKLVYLKMSSMIHITLPSTRFLLWRAAMTTGTSDVDWWLTRTTASSSMMPSRLSPDSFTKNRENSIKTVAWLSYWKKERQMGPTLLPDSVSENREIGIKDVTRLNYRKIEREWHWHCHHALDKSKKKLTVLIIIGLFRHSLRHIRLTCVSPWVQPCCYDCQQRLEQNRLYSPEQCRVT